MLLDRSLYERIVSHCVCVIESTAAEVNPFPHIVLKDVFPADVFQRLLTQFPPESSFAKANPKHHQNEYGGSTRRRMTLAEGSFAALSETDHEFWATVRAAIGSRTVRDSLFSKLALGLCRRFRVSNDQLPQIPAFPRGQLYSEVEGFRIAPHPDTREKVVTMQFALAQDTSLEGVGTEFYTRSLNPIDYLREPRGFSIAKTMPFLPNHAYAFSVLNDFGLKSWHGRSTIPPLDRVRNSLLHIWYLEADQTNLELKQYEQYLRTPAALRKTA